MCAVGCSADDASDLCKLSLSGLQGEADVRESNSPIISSQTSPRPGVLQGSGILRRAQTKEVRPVALLGPQPHSLSPWLLGQEEGTSFDSAPPRASCPEVSACRRLKGSGLTDRDRFTSLKIERKVCLVHSFKIDFPPVFCQSNNKRLTRRLLILFSYSFAMKVSVLLLEGCFFIYITIEKPG